MRKKTFTMIVLFLGFTICFAQIDKTVPLAETLEEFNKVKNDKIEFDELKGIITVNDSISFKITDVKDDKCITLIEPDANTGYLKFEKKDGMKESVIQVDNMTKEKRIKLKTILIHLYKLYLNSEWIQKKKDNREEFFN